jgi:hypothetical protein
MEYIVDFSWDAEAGVWTAICDEIPLALESNSFDALIERVKICAAEILEMNAPARPFRLCIQS